MNQTYEKVRETNYKAIKRIIKSLKAQASLNLELFLRADAKLTPVLDELYQLRYRVSELVAQNERLKERNAKLENLVGSLNRLARDTKLD